MPTYSTYDEALDAAGGDTGRVCGAYDSDQRPIYWVDDGRPVREVAFELKNKRKMTEAEEVLSELTRQMETAGA